MFSRLFGKGDKQAKPRESGRPTGTGSVTHSLEKLDSAVELLEKREAVLEKKMEAELERAKQYHAKKNTQAALQCMKRKKLYEEQLMSISAQKQNLETLKFTIQNQNMNNEVLEAQQRAKEELKQSNKKMNADRVEENMEELLEEMDKANAVAEALRQPLDNQVLDEEDLMGELMAELEDTKVHETVALPTMPHVPTGDLPQKTKKQEEEEVDEDEEALRALEAELQS
ncbi:Snf7 family [Trypanosoma melophagium]|uniref:Snf7 family n=1 Tax=Trypanosoma melophagium TaxID=715481 RepID=UPI00351A2CC6|nr:Snf7 family [Trypanosoma melophagium]